VRNTITLKIFAKLMFRRQTAMSKSEIAIHDLSRQTPYYNIEASDNYKQIKYYGFNLSLQMP
jgi:hypothetical protein